MQAETARCAESRRVGQASTDPNRILPADITAENLVVCHGETPVLNGVSFVIPAGRVIGFVGPSGAGKSTLVDSLLGLIVPSEGKIAVGDVSLGDVDLHGWRRRIGYVSQDTFLFHDTIANNIRWSVPDAPMQTVATAARAAGLEGFVASLDLGFDTIVGDRGVKLSGGQRQRISLARALMRDPSLLILDEATSALDSLSEQEVMSVINALRGTCTVVIVAHRLAAVRDADLIYVLDHGAIIEHGTWRSLTQRKALFHRLLQAQAVGDR
jgi:ABC-type multidrug transport system fused ATPase/permease subunit